jgi:MYXO-CTERM domain-containing protein
MSGRSARRTVVAATARRASARPRGVGRRARSLFAGVLLLIVVVVVGAVLVASADLFMAAAAAGPAAADPIGDCSTTTGVIVVVDFAPWGGNIERGCDATLTTGYDALHRAGFTTAGDSYDGPGFICRIDDEPAPAEQSCATTPPAGAYWSYWHADVGQDTWSYSQSGAMSYRPPAGSVDAWVFGATDIDGTDGQPSFAPSAVRATNTSVGPGTSTTAAPTTTVASTAGTGGEAPPSTLAASSTTRAGATATVPRSTSPTSPPPSTTTTPVPSDQRPGGGRNPTPKIVDASPAPTPQPTAGSPVPFIVGTVVVAALAGAAGLVAWRRRRLG